MLSASKQYFLTESIELKQQLLAAGQGLVLRYKGSAFDVYYLFGIWWPCYISNIGTIVWVEFADAVNDWNLKTPFIRFAFKFEPSCFLRGWLKIKWGFVHTVKRFGRTILKLFIIKRRKLFEFNYRFFQRFRFFPNSWRWSEYLWLYSLWPGFFFFFNEFIFTGALWPGMISTIPIT